MKPLAHEEPPEPVTVTCPRCGDLYVEDMDPYEDWPDLEEMEWEAEEALAAECPDHPHLFEVGV